MSETHTFILLIEVDAMDNETWQEAIARKISYMSHYQYLYSRGALPFNKDTLQELNDYLKVTQ